MSETEQPLTKIVDEAIQLRFSGERLPEGQVTPAAAQSVLLDVRKRLDRVEELLVVVLRVRGRAQRKARALQDDVDDEWAKAIQNRWNSPQRRTGNDYSGAKERYAEADLAVLEERMTQRAAQKEADLAQEAYDVVRVCQRGLDTLRQDCVAYLRSLQFESSLER